MTSHSRHLILVLFLIALSSATARSQALDTTIIVRIETKDGNEYVGNIIESTVEYFRLQTRNIGTITIRKRDIVDIEEIDSYKIRDNTIWFQNPQATRYLWAPNGYGLRKGEGYYQNIWVLFNHASIGVTDNFSLGVGVIPLFMFAGAATPAWITPKFSLPITEDKVNVGLGGLFGTVIGVEDTGFGLAFGHLTLGGRDGNVSFGMGYGYAGADWANYPALSLAASIRTGPRGYFLTENYYLSSESESVGLLSFAGERLFKNVGLDYGVILPLATDGLLIAVPWLGFTIPFVKNAQSDH